MESQEGSCWGPTSTRKALVVFCPFFCGELQEHSESFRIWEAVEHDECVKSKQRQNVESIGNCPVTRFLPFLTNKKYTKSPYKNVIHSAYIRPLPEHMHCLADALNSI